MKTKRSISVIISVVGFIISSSNALAFPSAEQINKIVVGAAEGVTDSGNAARRGIYSHIKINGADMDKIQKEMCREHSKLSRGYYALGKIKNFTWKQQIRSYKYLLENCTIDEEKKKMYVKSIEHYNKHPEWHDKKLPFILASPDVFKRMKNKKNKISIGGIKVER